MRWLSVVGAFRTGVVVCFVLVALVCSGAAGASAASSVAWAVGFRTKGTATKTLIEHLNGTAWKVQTSVNPSTSFNELKGVAAVSPSDAWAVGYSKSGTSYKTLVEHWNGTA